jgi:hypothetical protein
MYGAYTNIICVLGFPTNKNQRFKSVDPAGHNLQLTNQSSNTSLKTLMELLAVHAEAQSCIK